MIDSVAKAGLHSARLTLLYSARTPPASDPTREYTNCKVVSCNAKPRVTRVASYALVTLVTLVIT